MRYFMTLMAAMLCMGILAGCAGGKIAGGFAKDEVLKEAKEAVDLVNEKDYETLNSMMTQQMADAGVTDQIEAAWDQLGLGEFKSYKTETVVGQKDEDGNDIAVAVLVTEYENASVQFQVAFDQEMKITGFYIK